MAEKKTTANKASKAKPATKKAPAKKSAPKKEVINWDELPEEMFVILNGKETKAYKQTAKILVESGKATLK